MGKTILVVDDSVGIRAAITMTLSSAGFYVIEAADGEAALIQLEKRRVTSLFQTSTCLAWMA
ncbi:hypothetical protein [Aeromonas sp. 1HA1]|uniref:hypothetical protein n=1 Tax=Aeromonas sp. 1HA1 TaxID=2699193 RepID=UPI0023DD9410|nr:hypothetical protein [Aeromonas sp. 1HA1]